MQIVMQAKTTKTISVALLIIILLTGCGNQDFDFSKACIEGRVPDNLAYKSIYADCYSSTLWIEVISDRSLGEDVKIFTPSPTNNPVDAIEYSNVVEVPLPDEFANSARADTLLGKRVFFQYRKPNESEISAFRNSLCSEVYSTHSTPFLIITHFSFTQCPKSNE